MAQRIERQERVFDLKLRGYSYHQIAEMIPCSSQTAYKDVIVIVKQRTEQLGENVDQLRTMEAASLDLIERQLFQRMEDADTEMFLKIVDRVLKLKQRRAIMRGLDLGNEPDKILALSINVTPDANVPLRATFVENLARSVGHPPTASDVLNDLRVKRLPEKIIDGNGRGGNGKIGG